MRRSRTPPLLAAGARRPSRICLDLALDLLVPPLSMIALLVATLMAGAMFAFWMNPRFSPFLWLGLACAGVVSLYVLRGWYLSGTGLPGLMDLARAPLFMIWKAVAMRGVRAVNGWTRTDRERS